MGQLPNAGTRKDLIEARGVETPEARAARLQAQAANLAADVFTQAAEREEAAKAAADAAFVAKLEAAGLPIPVDLRATRIAAEAAEREKALADQAEAIAAAKAQREAERDNEVARKALPSRETEAVKAQRPAVTTKAAKVQPEPIDYGPALSPEALADLRRATLARLLVARGITDPADLEAALDAATGNAG